MAKKQNKQDQNNNLDDELPANNKGDASRLESDKIISQSEEELSHELETWSEEKVGIQEDIQRKFYKNNTYDYYLQNILDQSEESQDRLEALTQLLPEEVTDDHILTLINWLCRYKENFDDLKKDVQWYITHGDLSQARKEWFEDRDTHLKYLFIYQWKTTISAIENAWANDLWETITTQWCTDKTMISIFDRAESYGLDIPDYSTVENVSYVWDYHNLEKAYEINFIFSWLLSFPWSHEHRIQLDKLKRSFPDPLLRDILITTEEEIMHQWWSSTESIGAMSKFATLWVLFRDKIDLSVMTNFHVRQCARLIRDGKDTQSTIQKLLNYLWPIERDYEEFDSLVETLGRMKEVFEAKLKRWKRMRVKYSIWSNGLNWYTDSELSVKMIQLWIEEKKKQIEYLESWYKYSRDVFPESIELGSSSSKDLSNAKKELWVLESKLDHIMKQDEIIEVDKKIQYVIAFFTLLQDQLQKWKEFDIAVISALSSLEISQNSNTEFWWFEKLRDKRLRPIKQLTDSLNTKRDEYFDASKKGHVDTKLSLNISEKELKNIAQQIGEYLEFLANVMPYEKNDNSFWYIEMRGNLYLWYAHLLSIKEFWANKARMHMWDNEMSDFLEKICKKYQNLFIKKLIENDNPVYTQYTKKLFAKDIYYLWDYIENQPKNVTTKTLNLFHYATEQESEKVTSTLIEKWYKANFDEEWLSSWFSEFKLWLLEKYYELHWELLFRKWDKRKYEMETQAFYENYKKSKPVSNVFSNDQHRRSFESWYRENDLDKDRKIKGKNLSEMGADSQTIWHNLIVDQKLSEELWDKYLKRLWGYADKKCDTWTSYIDTKTGHEVKIQHTAIHKWLLNGNTLWVYKMNDLLLSRSKRCDMYEVQRYRAYSDWEKWKLVALHKAAEIKGRSLIHMMAESSTDEEDLAMKLWMLYKHPTLWYNWVSDSSIMERKQETKILIKEMLIHVNPLTKLSGLQTLVEYGHLDTATQFIEENNISIRNWEEPEKVMNLIAQSEVASTWVYEWFYDKYLEENHSMSCFPRYRNKEDENILGNKTTEVKWLPDWDYILYPGSHWSLDVEYRAPTVGDLEYNIETKQFYKVHRAWRVIVKKGELVNVSMLPNEQFVIAILSESDAVMNSREATNQSSSLEIEERTTYSPLLYQDSDHLLALVRSKNPKKLDNGLSKWIYSPTEEIPLELQAVLDVAKEANTDSEIENAWAMIAVIMKHYQKKKNISWRLLRAMISSYKDNPKLLALTIDQISSNEMKDVYYSKRYTKDSNKRREIVAYLKFAEPFVQNKDTYEQLFWWMFDE